MGADRKIRPFLFLRDDSRLLVGVGMHKVQGCPFSSGRHALIHMRVHPSVNFVALAPCGSMTGGQRSPRARSRWQEAAGLLRDLTAQFPTSADAHRLFGLGIAWCAATPQAPRHNVPQQALALESEIRPELPWLFQSSCWPAARIEEALTVVAELAKRAGRRHSTFSLLRLLLSKRLLRLDEAAVRIPNAQYACGPAKRRGGTQPSRPSRRYGALRAQRSGDPPRLRQGSGRGRNLAGARPRASGARAGTMKPEAAFREVLRRRPRPRGRKRRTGAIDMDAHRGLAGPPSGRSTRRSLIIRACKRSGAEKGGIPAIRRANPRLPSLRSAKISNRQPDAEPMVHVVAARLCSDTAARNWRCAMPGKAARALPDDSVCARVAVRSVSGGRRRGRGPESGGGEC